MSNTLLGALIAASFLHAAWNLGSRHWRGAPGFLPAVTFWGWLWMLAILPWSWSHLVWKPATFAFAIVSGAGLAAYLIWVRRAYAHGDISLVYPIIRSSPIWVSLIGAIFLGERLSLLASFGIFLTVAGVAALPLVKFSPREACRAWFLQPDLSTRFAVAASLATCVYTISDRLAMETGQGPLAGFALVAVSYPVGLLIWHLASPSDFAGIKWKRLAPAGVPVRWAILFGFCISTAYAIIVSALTVGETGRVLAVANLGVLIGALGGIWLFREYGSLLPRLLGLVLTVGGVILLRLF